MKTPRNHQFAKRQRQTMSPPEVRLWVRLRSRNPDGLTFRRQHPIGPYVLDFYCAQAKLAIEVDGADHTRDDQMTKDAARDQWLLEKGIATYRIPAGDLLRDADEIALGVYILALKRAAKA